MPLELATTIEELDSSYPLGGDPTNKGDDHLRLLKSVLKAIFPGEAGNGFATPITSTEEELNYLTGLTSNAQDQIDDLQSQITALGDVFSAPTGTRMTFHQESPPPGWTQTVAFDNHMLRVVDGVGGGSGGSHSPILNDKVPVHTHTTTVTDPGHTHLQDWNNSIGIDGDYHGSGALYRNNAGFPTTSSKTGITVNVAANSGENWTPKYVDMIMAVKD